MSLWRLLKSPNIFTLESSFYGFENKDKNSIIPFTTDDYRNIGKSVCIALFKMVYKEKIEIIHIPSEKIFKSATFKIK